MFKGLMHAIIGNSQNPLLNAAQGSTLMASGYPHGSISMAQAPKSKKLFYGTVEVLQVANGYIVNIGRKEGYEYETYIAETITDVNERIAAAIVAFQLEGK
jgi:hypothetical protein